MSGVLDAKVVLLGSASVGKTSLICRAVSNEFEAEQATTIGASFSTKEVELGDMRISLQIWDTAGQERFRTLAPMYYRGAVVALLVFSLDEATSLKDVRSWADELADCADDVPRLFVIGNKADIRPQGSTISTDAEALAKVLGASYAEVSAKTGEAVDELFVNVAEAAFKKLKCQGALGSMAGEKGVTLKAETSTAKAGRCKC
jgi:small GTP-binding protein